MDNIHTHGPTRWAQLAAGARKCISESVMWWSSPRRPQSLKHLGYSRKDEGGHYPRSPTKNNRILEAEGRERATALTCTRNGEEACVSRARTAGACLGRGCWCRLRIRVKSALYRKFKRKTEGFNKIFLAAVLRMNCKGTITSVTAEGLAGGSDSLWKHTQTHRDLTTGTGYGKSLYLLLNFAMNLKVL